MRIGSSVLACLAVGTLLACAPHQDEPVATGIRAVPTPTPAEAGECDTTLVPARDVTVVGPLTAAEQETTEWALERFDAAGLKLPAVLEVAFDPTRVTCGGERGLCLADADPPAVRVCEPAGDTAFRSLNRRITLLHELAHVWFAVTPVPAVEIVGGVVGGDADVRWGDRTSERVAVVVTWGLLDQPRRPLPTTVPCWELYVQFATLTGSDPLGPLEPICVPDDADSVG